MSDNGARPRQAHQIEQLKEEVSAKDAALVKEHFGHVRAEQECESLRTEGDQARPLSSCAEPIRKVPEHSGHVNAFLPIFLEPQVTAQLVQRTSCGRQAAGPAPAPSIRNPAR